MATKLEMFFKMTQAERIPPAVSGPDGENTARSRNQSDCRICRIPPTHELRKKIKKDTIRKLAYR